MHIKKGSSELKKKEFRSITPSTRIFCFSALPVITLGISKQNKKEIIETFDFIMCIIYEAIFN